MEDHSQSLRYTWAGFWKGIRWNWDSPFLYTRYGSWVVWGGLIEIHDIIDPRHSCRSSGVAGFLEIL